MSESDSGFSYLRWAKLCSAARFNLATSGVENLPLHELPVRIEELEITGPDGYGYCALRERLARKTGAPDDCLILSLGTSMANFIALAAIIDSGDEVVIEQPTYQPMLQIAQWLGANVRRFRRDPASGWQVDLEELGRLVGPATRAIVLSNLHNPSSAWLEDETLGPIGDMAAHVGATVFVDEVYLETIFDRPWRSAFFLGDNFVATSSLTKGYGLSGLRCGWILAQPQLARRMSDLIDLTYGALAHSAERLSVIALDHLPKIASRAKTLLDRNRALLNSFLIAHSDRLDCNPSVRGTTIAPRLRRGDVQAFCERLRDQFETTVVPGHFFGAPEHFRIGIGGPTEILQHGLERISSALIS